MSKIVLKTYSDFWQVETVLYHLEGIRMPIPMSARNAGYFIFGEFVAIVISKVPVLNLIMKLPILNQPLFYYIGMPFVIMKVLSSIKIEGKHPYQFMRDMFKYAFFTPGHYEYMQPLRGKAAVSLKKHAPCRRVTVKSVFEEKSKENCLEIVVDLKGKKSIESFIPISEE